MKKIRWIQWDWQNLGNDGAAVQTNLRKLDGLIRQHDLDLVFLNGLAGLDEKEIEELWAFGEELRRDARQLKVFLFAQGPAWKELENLVWPENFHLFSDYEPVLLEEWDLLIHGGAITGADGRIAYWPRLAWVNPKHRNILILPHQVTVSEDLRPPGFEVFHDWWNGSGNDTTRAGIFDAEIFGVSSCSAKELTDVFMAV